MKEEILKTGVTLICFWSNKIDPSKKMINLIDSIYGDGYRNFKIIKINIDNSWFEEYNKNIIKEHEINILPYIVIYKDGIVFTKLVGLQTDNMLISTVSSALEN